MALSSKKGLGLTDTLGMFESDEFVQMVLIIAHFRTKTTQSCFILWTAQYCNDPALQTFLAM
jgi:hypothetical protein